MCQTADIGLEAHMCFADFAEGHGEHRSDFPKVSPVINYDLICHTAKMRVKTEAMISFCSNTVSRPPRLYPFVV